MVGVTGGSCDVIGGSCDMTGGSCGVTGGSCDVTGGSCVQITKKEQAYCVHVPQS